VVAPETHGPGTADREKRGVALSSLGAALVLVVLKAVVGFATNSLGILSEAAHSGLDLVAAGITFWAVSVSGRPADREHTYGHGKFENLSALFETLLLLATCVWIIYEAISRLCFAGEVHVDANIWAFLVIIVSIVVDYSRSRALMRAAKKHHSQALEADALHFSTDIWSSTVVLIGLLGVLMAEKINLPWLAKADSVAALGVATIVVWVSLRLGKKSVDDLLDRVPEDLQQKVASAAAGVPGVEDVTQVRVRRSGPEVFADVTLTVNQAAPFEGAHKIASRAEAAVRVLLPEADVVVHVEPADSGPQDATTMVRMLADRHGLGAHGIRIYEEGGVRSLELHLEVDESLDLESAHRQASRFEQALHENLPELVRIVTHIEPSGDASATRQAESIGRVWIDDVLREFLEAHRVSMDPHDVKVQLDGGELAVSFHCTLDPATNIAEAHDLTEKFEDFLRTRIRNLGRVVIHVEPHGPGDGSQDGH